MHYQLTPLLDGVLGTLQREQRRKIYSRRPEVWSLDVLGIEMWSGQVHISRTIVENKNTMVAAGHGVGKTLLAAVLACWWIDTHQIGEARVLTTAPSTSQVRNGVWNEIQKLHRLSRQRWEEYRRRVNAKLPIEGYPDHSLPGYITTQATWKTDDGQAIGFGRTPPRGREGDTFQGIHGNVFAIADEAVGVSEDMIQTLANNTSNANDRRLLIANPTNPRSHMGKTWHDPEISKAWAKLTISVLDSPMFTDEHKRLKPETIRYLTDQTYVDDKKIEYGEDSANYISRVLGRWAMESGMILFPDEVLEIARETVVVPDPDGVMTLGFDVARSEKGDYSFIYSMQPGKVFRTKEWVVGADGGDWVDLPKPVDTGKRGFYVRHLDHWRGIPFQPLHNGQGQRVQGGANERVDALMRENGARQLRIDADGMGINMVDAMFDVMREDYEYEIIRMKSNDPSPDKNAWYNNRAFQYDNLARLMRQGLIDLDPEDVTLFDQLGAIEYKFASGTAESMLIEKKTELRRKGIKSPDAADAVWYAMADVSHLFEEEPVGSRVELDIDRQLVDDYDPTESSFFSMAFN
jgi:hypothetical protein